MKKATRLQAQRGCWLGPSVIIGHQGQNLWLSLAGRCFLVAPEHIRALAPDENVGLKPLIREGLEQLQRAAQSDDYVDLAREQIPQDELDEALQQPLGNDPEGMLPEDRTMDDETHQPVGSVSEPAGPLQELPPEPVVTDPADVDDQLRDVVDRHLEPEKRKAEEEADSLQHRVVEDETSAASEVDPQPVSWKPHGEAANLKWKRVRLDDAPSVHVYGDEEMDPGAASSGPAQNEVVLYGTKRILTGKVKKKLLDREVPWEKIPPEHARLYEQAEDVEWDEWTKRGSVRVCPLDESKRINDTVDAARIIGLRFVYRDKNASVRTPQAPLPVKAKARLYAQAYEEPLAKAGLVKVDSSTKQRMRIMVFLQLTVNLGWIKQWRKGDVKAAFLQGKERQSLHHATANCQF